MNEALTNLRLGRFEAIPDNMLYPVLRLLSATPINLEECSKINRKAYYIKPKISYSLMHFLNTNTQSYPKGQKTIDKKQEIIQESARTLFRWSKNESNKNKAGFEALKNNKQFVEWLDKKIGFEPEQAKQLGITRKFEKYQYKTESTPSILSFM